MKPYKYEEEKAVTRCCCLSFPLASLFCTATVYFQVGSLKCLLQFSIKVWNVANAKLVKVKYIWRHSQAVKQQNST
jgi:hypothetical protein